MYVPRTIIVAASLLLSAAPAFAQHEGHGTAAKPHAERLGTVVWPNSGARAAQASFLRGVALLHSFEYPDAQEAFRAATRRDPAFALAHWGEAFARSQFLWGSEDLPAARAALARLGPTPAARLARAGSARERRFGAAVEAFLAEGSPRDRARAFADSARAWAMAEPGDAEALSFASLGAMFGARGASADEAARRYDDAIAFAERVMREHPDHPGGVHYLIHATDSPRYAERGLAAARRYDQLAPDADHALHMPSHIYLQLGMWDDVIASNERSWPASRAWVARHRRPPSEASWHALEWLQYGYLQAGRWQAARALIDTGRAVLAGIDLDTLGGYPDVQYAVANLAFQYGAETGRWDAYDAAIAAHVARATTAPAASASARAIGMATTARYRAAVAAVLGRGDAGAALAAATALEGDAAGAAGERRVLMTRMAAQLRGFAARAAGDPAAAVAHFERAAADDASIAAATTPFGPPGMIPVLETLGLALLEAGRPAEAVRAYERALEGRRERSPALLGLARARAAAGDAVGSAAALARLAAARRQPDADVPRR